MEYTIQKLGELAGVSTRTLRYYDEIDLLKPSYFTASGYRVYGSEEVNRLQQILFYKELGVSLDSIKSILDSTDFDSTVALKEHHHRLLEKRAQIDKLIQNVERTILEVERGIPMSDQDKFDGFKKKLIEENEKQYGEEIRKKYSDQEIDASNAKLKNMSKEQYEEITALEEAIIEQLKTAIEDGDPAGEAGQKAATLHKEWISFYWNSYSKEAHVGVAHMYVTDERFTNYYDSRAGSGAAAFLRDAILVYTS